MALRLSPKIVVAGLVATLVVPRAAASHATAPSFAVADGGVGVYAPVGAQVSGNGRYVVFAAVTTPEYAVGQGEGVGYGGVGTKSSSRQIYLVDLTTHRRELISANRRGLASDGNAGDPSVSADGRYVVFSSAADDLVANDTNLAVDVFVRDRVTHTTRRVDLTARGQQLLGDAQAIAAVLPSISADGSTIVFFTSSAVMPGERVGQFSNGTWFAATKKGVSPVAADPRTGLPARTMPNDCQGCYPAAVSRDGRRVAYGAHCVFLSDVRTKTARQLWCPEGNTPGSPAHLDGVAAVGRVALSADADVVVWDLLTGTNEGDFYELVYAYSARTGKTVEIDGGIPLAFQPTVSGDGRRAVFVGRDGIGLTSPEVAFLPASRDTSNGDDARGGHAPANGNAHHVGDVLYSVDLGGATPAAPVEVACSDTVNCTPGGSYWPSLSTDGKTLTFVTLAQLAADDPDTPMTGTRSAPMDPDDVYVLR